MYEGVKRKVSEGKTVGLLGFCLNLRIALGNSHAVEK